MRDKFEGRYLHGAWKTIIIPDPGSDEALILAGLDELNINEKVKVITSRTEAAALTAYESMIEKAEKIGASKLEAWANQS